jgi:hypothetical protein
MTTETRKARSYTEKKRKVSQYRTSPQDFLKRPPQAVSETLTVAAATRAGGGSPVVVRHGRASDAS